MQYSESFIKSQIAERGFVAFSQNREIDRVRLLMAQAKNFPLVEVQKHDMILAAMRSLPQIDMNVAIRWEEQWLDFERCPLPDDEGLRHRRYYKLISLTLRLT